MAISNSHDAVKDYFGELLGPVASESNDEPSTESCAESRSESRSEAKPQAKPELRADANSFCASKRNRGKTDGTQQSLAPDQSVSDQSVPDRSQSDRNQASANMMQVADRSIIAQPAVPESKTALEDRQKNKLQALLNQQAIAKIAVETKADKTIPENLTQASPATDDPDQTASSVEIESLVEAPVETPAEPSIEEGFYNKAARSVVWNENGRPEWAQEDFDALLFDVGGLTLAVPLVSLGQIVPLNRDNLTPIFGQSDWFMGILSANVGKLRVVNTALFVMPEKYNDAFLDNAEYVVSLDGVPWALAVNKVNQPVRLTSGDIKWRSDRSKRPWLAGTVKESMCALLDVPQMATILNKSDKHIEASSLNQSDPKQQ